MVAVTIVTILTMAMVEDPATTQAKGLTTTLAKSLTKLWLKLRRWSNNMSDKGLVTSLVDDKRGESAVTKPCVRCTLGNPNI